MSILEVVLQQKIILITLVFALVPLLAALVLWLLPRLRRSRIQRQRRVAEAKAAAVAAAANAPERAAETLPVKSALPTAASQPAQPAATPQASPSTPAGQPQPVPQQAGAAAPAATPTPETPAEQPGQPASSGLTDLLSVFDDDENSGKREALLKGLNPVDMAELAALSQQIAAELHTRQEG